MNDRTTAEAKSIHNGWRTFTLLGLGFLIALVVLKAKSFSALAGTLNANSAHLTQAGEDAGFGYLLGSAIGV